MVRSSLVMYLLLFLCACGGSGGGNSSPPAPVSVGNQQLSLDEDSPLAFSLNGLLSTSGDTIEILNEPTNGTLSGTVAQMTYTPNENFSGSDQATVSLRNGQRSTTPFDLLFTIAAVDDAPTNSGMPSSFSTTAFESLEVGPTISNPDGLPLSTTVQNLPPWATIDSANGRIIGRPSNGDVRSWDNISMTVSNDAGSFTTAPFSINVAFQPLIRLPVSFTIEGFTQRSTRINGDVVGSNLFLYEDGYDTTGADRTAIQLFDPLSNEVVWQTLLPVEYPYIYRAHGHENGALITTADDNFNGVVSAISLEGTLLWSFTLSPFSGGLPAFTRDLAVLADGRVIALVSMGSRPTNVPEEFRVVLYDPASGSLTETPFDSGVLDAPGADFVLPETDGGYLLFGGDTVAPADYPSDTWVRRYDASGNEVYTTLFSGRGDATGAFRLLNGDIIVTGYQLYMTNWFARLDATGSSRYFQEWFELDFNPARVAGRADGGYAAVSDVDLKEWSATNELIEERSAGRSDSITIFVSHPDYDILQVDDSVVTSVPAP